MLEKIKEIIKEQTGNDSPEITRETVLMSDLGLSSLDLMSMVCILEDKFDVEIPDRVIGTFKTVGNVVDFLENNRAD